MLDARAWLVWLVAVLAVASTTRNPLYLAQVALSLAVVWTVAIPTARADRRGLAVSPWRLALVLLPLGVVFNALTVHVGQTVLFRLPAGWPLIGGAITLEAAVFGALNGAALLLLLVGFGVLNAAVAMRDLLRLTPRAFHQVGVVVSIALTFFPHTLATLARVREAQAIRGHRVRGVRDWTPLVVPLLVGGLEQAMGLAEAMVARGYGTTRAAEQPVGVRLFLVLGLLGILLGWAGRMVLPAWALRLGWAELALGTALAVLGAALVVGALWWAGRGVLHTTYRPRRLDARDAAVMAAAGLALVPVLLPGRLAYPVYPSLTLPPFDLLIGGLLLGLLGPALFGSGHRLVTPGSDADATP
jgi:energy-coupling factor transport system permease protein